MENILKIKDQNLKKKKNEKEIKEGNLKNKIIVIYNFNSKKKKKKLSLTLFYYTRDTYTLCIRFVFVSILKYIFYQNFNIFPIKNFFFNIFKKKRFVFFILWVNKGICSFGELFCLGEMKAGCVL